ncbi:hypothetical protein UFOVP1229_173 [uncultured Caudovirales phage]|uniref:Uncharacterized protein n=1 Tax=uncultured Caudovirales phage TaxID=2100421 RepID=A0A6J5RJD4_9CAUD|nr:hypothetical protein UFOVP1229_173 [uncultured Caudovirales phage]
MKVESLIKITIGETVHQIAMDEAKSLFVELQKLFPPAFVISSPPSDDMRDAIEDAFGRRGNEPWMVPMKPWMLPPQPYRVYPPRTEVTFEDGSPV